MVAKGVWGTGVITAVTVYLVLVLVVPPGFDLNDCHDFSWRTREKTCCRGVNLSYVLATVCKRHRHQVGRGQGSNSHSR